MSHIAVISMGGTIAMAPSASGGIVPALGADDLETIGRLDEASGRIGPNPMTATF